MVHHALTGGQRSDGSLINAIRLSSTEEALWEHFDPFLSRRPAPADWQTPMAVRPRVHERLGGQIVRMHGHADVLTRSCKPIVYVARAPAAVAESFAAASNRPIGDVVRWMMRAATIGQNTATNVSEPLSSWSAHVMSWLPRATLVIRYEDMLARPADTLKATLKVLGISRKPTAVLAAVEACRFERLAADEAAHGFMEAQPGVRFFRSGRGVGGLSLSALEMDTLRRTPAARTLGYV